MSHPDEHACEAQTDETTAYGFRSVVRSKGSPTTGRWVLADEDGEHILIAFCPWCGVKLPKPCALCGEPAKDWYIGKPAWPAGFIYFCSDCGVALMRTGALRPDAQPQTVAAHD